MLPNQLERENPKNAHFESGGSPACINNFGATFDFFICFLFHLYHLISFSHLSTLPTCFPCHLLSTFSFYYSTIVIHLHIVFNIHLAFTFYCFTLTSPWIKSTFWFFLSPLALTLWKRSCHIGLAFTLTMPPRMGAFPPSFPLENSFPFPLRRT